MNGSFSAHAVSLGEVLSGPNVYTMPGFQRPYCWTAVEVGCLLEDILFAVNELDLGTDKKPVFFLGTIVLIGANEARRAGLGTRSSFDIVDGQQRFVTLTMLIAVLRDLARADGDLPLAERLDALIAFEPDRGTGERDYRVSMRESDEAVLIQYAKQMDGCLADADPEQFEGAQRDLVLNRNYLLEELRGLDRSIRTQLADFLERNCQVVVISTDDTDSAFRIFMVVNQQGKPLSRNDLLKAELIGAVPVDERDAYVARWEDAERGCGTEFEQLFSHVRTALGNGRIPVIREMRKLVQAEGGSKPFLDRYLLPIARVHAALRGRATGEPLLNAPALRHVRTLERLSHADWMPPALLWIYERQGHPDEIADFLSALDRVAYGHLILGLGRDKRSARYAAVIEDIRIGKTPHAPRGSLTLTADEQRNIAHNVAADLYDRSSQACKLLLLRLNDALGGGLVQVDVSNITVEHILPQRVARNSLWRQKFSEAELREYSGSLGNLVLVSPATNKAARNYDFDKKVALYRQDAEMSRLPINQDVITADNFGPDQIRARSEQMLDLMRTLWHMTPARQPLTIS